MLVLPPGGNGTIPFTVSSDSNVTFNASLSFYFGAQGTQPSGVEFTLSSSNLTVNPGEETAVNLTVTADKEALAALYTPTIDVQPFTPEGSEQIEYGSAATPELLVANFTPACVFLLNEPLVNEPSNVPTELNASVGSVPSLELMPGIFLANPTITLNRGGNSTLAYICFTQDKLTLNVTPPAGLTAQFSPVPVRVIAENSSWNMYTLTIIADEKLPSVRITSTRLASRVASRSATIYANVS